MLPPTHSPYICIIGHSSIIMLWLMRAWSAVRDLQLERSGRVADKARGFALFKSDVSN